MKKYFKPESTSSRCTCHMGDPMRTATSHTTPAKEYVRYKTYHGMPKSLIIKIPGLQCPHVLCHRVQQLPLVFLKVCVGGVQVCVCMCSPVCRRILEQNIRSPAVAPSTLLHAELQGHCMLVFLCQCWVSKLRSSCPHSQHPHPLSNLSSPYFF